MAKNEQTLRTDVKKIADVAAPQNMDDETIADVLRDVADEVEEQGRLAALTNLDPEKMTPDQRERLKEIREDDDADDNA